MEVQNRPGTIDWISMSATVHLPVYHVHWQLQGADMTEKHSMCMEKNVHGSRETRLEAELSASAGKPPPSWIKAQMQLLKRCGGGGGGGEQIRPTTKWSKTENHIHCIHVSLVWKEQKYY